MSIAFARALRGVLVAASLGLGLGACAEPLQNGGVVVFGGASARFDAMCRFRRGSEGGQSSCVPGASDAPRATAARISSESQLLKGPRAAGAVGDVLLTNGEISFVFSGENGALLDAVDAHVGRDELVSMTTCVMDGADCLALAAAEFGQEKDGSAWVEVRPLGQKQFEARTRYILLPGARSLLVSTLISTLSPEAIAVSRVGDVVDWGLAQQTLPTGEAPPFVAGVGKDVAYAILPVDDRSSVGVDPFDRGSFIRHARDAVVSAGHPLRRDRVFVVAPRGDTLGVLTEVALMRDGLAPGAIEVRFVGADGSPVTPPAGGRVRVLSPTFPVEGYLAIGGAPEGPSVAGEAPPGKYELDFEGTGRHAMAKVPVEVRSGEVTQVVVALEVNQQPVVNAP